MTDIPEDVMKIAHRLASCTDPEILLVEIQRALMADRAAQAERMARLEEAAKNAAMYLKTGFIECQRCGEEVATANTDAEYELRRALSQEGSDA